MTSSVKAVAFDLDSTLCRYALSVREVTALAIARTGLADRLDATQELADAYNSAWWAEEEVRQCPVRELRRRAWARILEERGLGDEATATRLADAYSDIREETGLRLIDGVPELLADLKPRYPLGILTNGPSQMQWPKLRDLGLPEIVDHIVVAGDRGVFKPDPRPFEELLGMLGADAEATLFVGDSFEHDMVGAHAVGMQTAWVRENGQRPPTEASITPNRVLRSVLELREILL